MPEIVRNPISGAMIDLFAGAGGLSCGLGGPPGTEFSGSVIVPRG